MIVFGVVEYAPGRKVCLIWDLIPCGSKAGSGSCLLVPWGDDQTLVFLLQSSDET